ncbi:MAG: ATP-binding protein [Candidatus Bathyarchaeia archaeon]|jgi:hypothetical protein
MKLKGNIQVPENLKQIIRAIPPIEADEQGLSEKSLANISFFKRKIDPVLICTYFGLYKSRELPPLVEEIKIFSEKKDFSVEIGEFDDLLNHLLFCLWVKKNGFPDSCEDNVKYREDLYAFIKKLLDEDYYRNVLIPFYINKADERESGTSSFLHRLTSSDIVKLELADYSPEFLSREFSNAQHEFMEEVVKPILNHQPQQPNSKLKDFLLKDEGQCLEFKATLRYNIKAADDGHEMADPVLEKEVLSTICAFLNSEGGTLIIGVKDDDKKVFGLKNDFRFLPKKKDKDGFENYLRESLVHNVQPYIPRLVKIDFESVGNEEVCIVQVEKSSAPMFLKEKVGNRDIQELWIRDGNGKRRLDGVDMAEYIKRNWSSSA